MSCNYIVILQLSERELEDGEEKRVGDPLNPPQRNQDPAAPSPWLTVDSQLLTGLNVEDTLLNQREDETLSVPPTAMATLQKSLGDDIIVEFTALATLCHSRDSQQTDLRHVRAMVDQCAPHLALSTTKIEDIPFTPIAPVQQGRRKIKKSHKETHNKTPRTSVVANESKVSFTPQSTLETTTTSSSTTKSSRSRF